MIAAVSFDNTAPAGAAKRSVEASSLGMPPGKWPVTLLVSPTFGNGCPLVATQVQRDRDGDLQSVLYQQDFGTMQLVVFND